MVAQAFIPCTQETEVTGFHEFEASQVYILNSRTTKDTYIMRPSLKKRGGRKGQGCLLIPLLNHLVRKHYLKSGMMVDSYNPSTQEAEAGELPQAVN